MPTRRDSKKADRWEGGRVHVQADGRKLFIIERMYRGRRFHVSTRAHTYAAAMKQLQRFEADPLNYRPEGDAAPVGIRLTAELILEFRRFQTEVRGVTTKHATETASRLSDWADDLDGLDLRQLSLRDHIKPALEKRKGRAHRIIALKAFMAWLRKEKHLLTSGQDATLDLPVPQAQPEKWKRRKAVELERVRAVLPELAPAYRDVLLVLASTGWHVTELERFVRNEESEIVYPRRDDVLAVLVTRHKIGEPTRTPVKDAGVLAAAERLRERGEVPRKLNAAIKAACRAAGVKEFTAGVMRHSVATWLVESGEDPARVSQFLDHRDPRTTKRFYADVAVPSADVAVPRFKTIEGGKG